MKQILKLNSKKKTLKAYFLLSFILFLLFSMSLNYIMLSLEEKKYNPPGKLIEIDGHNMHIYGTGNGSPTVVMTCGSGTPSAYTEFFIMQRQLSNITRTCIYERPGYGWSEPASTSRDTEQIVSDLRKLLQKAGEKPPYLFVAHSMGAMEVLLYTHKYPDEVAGMVLIDGTSPYKHIYYSESSIPKVGVQALRILNKLGLVRITSELNLIPLLNKRLNSMPEEIRALEKANIYKNMLNDMVIKEGEPLKTSAEAMNGQLNFGSKPLVIFAADKSLQELPGWEKSQNTLLKLSTDSKLIVVKDSNHISILQDNSDEITNRIKALIYKIKKHN